MPVIQTNLALDSNKQYNIEFRMENGVLVGELKALKDNAGVLVQKLPELIELKIGDQIVKIDPVTNKFTMPVPAMADGKFNIEVKVSNVPIATLNADSKAQTMTIDEKEYKPLAVSETRILANNRSISVTAREKALKMDKPTTDLHTHWPGVPTVEDLIEIGIKNKMEYSVKTLMQMGITEADLAKLTKNGVINEKGWDGNPDDRRTVSLEEMSKLAPEVMDRLKSNLSIKTDQQATFQEMERIYNFRDPFTGNTKMLPDLLERAMQRYQENGVKYAEISWGKVLDPVFHEVLAREIPRIQAAQEKANESLKPELRKPPVKVGVLAGWARHMTQEWYESQTLAFKQMVGSPVVTGVDFIGYETNSTATFLKELDVLGTLNKTRKANGVAPFTIRIHAGESVHHQENVRLALEWAKANPDSKVRIAHGIFGIDDATIKLAKELSDRGQLIIEINPDSNLSLNNIDRFGQLPIEKYQKAGVKFVLSSDSPGMYRTDTDQLRTALAMSGIDVEAFNKMQREVEAQFLADRDGIVAQKEAWIKDQVDTIVAEAKTKGETLTPEQARQKLFQRSPELVAEMKRLEDAGRVRAAAQTKDAVAKTKDALKAKGIVVDDQVIIGRWAGDDEVRFNTETLKEVTEGRKPISITGTLPETMTETMREEYRKMIADYALNGINMDPRAVARIEAMKGQLAADDIRRADRELANRFLTNPESIPQEQRKTAQEAVDRVRYDNNARIEVEAAIRMMVRNADPAKAYFVTGGNDYGIEKIIHEEVAKRNAGKPPSQQLKLIATVAAKGGTPDVPDGVTHAVIVGEKYFDIPGRVAPGLVRMGGVFVGFGGNEIDSNKIVTAVNMNDELGGRRASVTLVSNVPGTLQEKADFFASRKLSVANGTAMLMKLARENPGMFPAGFADNITPEMEKILRKSLTTEGRAVNELKDIPGIEIKAKQILFDNEVILERVGNSTQFTATDKFDALMKKSPEAALIIAENATGIFSEQTVNKASAEVLRYATTEAARPVERTATLPVAFTKDQGESRFTNNERKVLDALIIANEALVDMRIGPDGGFRKISMAQKAKEAEGVSGDAKNGQQKQEPAVNKSILANMIMQGQAGGVADSQRIAVIMMDSLNQTINEFRKAPRRVDREFIIEKFGVELGSQVIKDMDAIQKGLESSAAGKLNEVPMEYRNAVAAVEVANLRMVVRSVGDKATLGANAPEGFVDITTEEGRRTLRDAIARAENAMKLEGVDQKAFTGTKEMIADAAAVRDGRLAPSELTDFSKRATLQRFQNGLASVAPYQDKVNNGQKLLPEQLRTAAYDTQNIDPEKFAGDVLHDNTEDRVFERENLNQIYERFGPEIGGRVAEATDKQPNAEQQRILEEAQRAFEAAPKGTAEELKTAKDALKTVEKKIDADLKYETKKAYIAKADLFKKMPLKTAAQLFEGQGALVAIPANANTQFSLEGALLKLSDFRQSMEAGMGSPELMNDRSASSGFQLGLLRDKELYIRPIVEALTSPEKQAEMKAMGVDMVAVNKQIAEYVETSKAYLANAIDIVAKDRNLTPDQHSQLKKLLLEQAPGKFLSREEVAAKQKEIRAKLTEMGLTDVTVEVKDRTGKLVPAQRAPLNTTLDATKQGDAQFNAINLDNLAENAVNIGQLEAVKPGIRPGVDLPGRPGAVVKPVEPVSAVAGTNGKPVVEDARKIAERLVVIEVAKGNPPDVWKMQDPVTKKIYYAKTAAVSEVDMTNRAANAKLPPDSPLEIAKPLVSGVNDIPAALKDTIQMQGDRTSFIIVEGVPLGASMGQLSFSDGMEIGRDPLRGKPVTAEEFKAYAESVKALNEQGIFSNDLSSNTEFVRDANGKLKVYTYDFDPEHLSKLNPGSKFEDVAQVAEAAKGMLAAGTLDEAGRAYVLELAEGNKLKTEAAALTREAAGKAFEEAVKKLSPENAIKMFSDIETYREFKKMVDSLPPERFEQFKASGSETFQKYQATREFMEKIAGADSPDAKRPPRRKPTGPGTVEIMAGGQGRDGRRYTRDGTAVAPKGPSLDETVWQKKQQVREIGASTRSTTVQLEALQAILVEQGVPPVAGSPLDRAIATSKQLSADVAAGKQPTINSVEVANLMAVAATLEPKLAQSIERGLEAARVKVEGTDRTAADQSVTTMKEQIAKLQPEQLARVKGATEGKPVTKPAKPAVDYWRIGASDQLAAHDPRLSHMEHVHKSPEALQKRLAELGITDISAKDLAADPAQRTRFEAMNQLLTAYEFKDAQQFRETIAAVEKSDAFNKVDPNSKAFATEVAQVLTKEGNLKAVKQRDIGKIVTTPERIATYEAIVQLVSEYKIENEKVLKALVEEVKNTPEFQKLITDPNISQDVLRAEMKKAIDRVKLTKPLERLPVYAVNDRVVTILVGGPATGKSTATEAMELKGKDLGAKVGSDEYKGILGDARKLGEYFGAVTHPESAYLVEQIRGRLDEMAQKGKAPNYTVEKFILQDWYADSIKKTGAKIQVVSTFLDDPAETIRRNGLRGDASGRYVETKVVLGVPQQVSEQAPRMFSDLMMPVVIYNTNVERGKPPIVVAEKASGSNTLIIRDAKSFNAFMFQAAIIETANSPEKVFPEGVRINDVIDGQMKAFAKSGISMSYVDSNGVEIAKVAEGKLTVINEVAFKASVGDPAIAEGMIKSLSKGVADGRRTGSPSTTKEPVGDRRADLGTGDPKKGEAGKGAGTTGQTEAGQPNGAEQVATKEQVAAYEKAMKEMRAALVETAGEAQVAEFWEKSGRNQPDYAQRALDGVDPSLRDTVIEETAKMPTKVKTDRTTASLETLKAELARKGIPTPPGSQLDRAIKASKTLAIDLAAGNPPSLTPLEAANLAATAGLVDAKVGRQVEDVLAKAGMKLDERVLKDAFVKSDSLFEDVGKLSPEQTEAVRNAGGVKGAAAEAAAKPATKEQVAAYEKAMKEMRASLAETLGEAKAAEFWEKSGRNKPGFAERALNGVDPSMRDAVIEETTKAAVEAKDKTTYAKVTEEMLKEGKLKKGTRVGELVADPAGQTKAQTMLDNTIGQLRAEEIAQQRANERADRIAEAKKNGAPSPDPKAPKPARLATEPLPFDPTKPFGAEQFVQGSNGKPMGLAELTDKITSGEYKAFTDGTILNAKGELVLAVRDPLNPAQDRVVTIPKDTKIPPEALDNMLKFNKPVANRAASENPYERLTAAAHKVNRPMNWAMMTIGGKGMLGMKNEDVLTWQGAESIAMFGSGLMGEAGSVVGTNAKNLKFAEMTRFAKASSLTGGLLRGTATAASPLMLKDGVKDILHVFGSDALDWDEKDTLAHNKKHAQENNSGTGFFFGYGDASSHDALRGVLKIATAAEGTAAVVKGGIKVAQVGKSLFVKKAQTKLAQQVAVQVGKKVAARLVTAATGWGAVILTVDLLLDVAVDAAERHTEEGLARINEGVGQRNDLKGKLAAYNPNTLFDMRRDIGLQDASSRKESYESYVGSIRAPREKVEAYIEMQNQWYTAAERLAQYDKRTAEIKERRKDHKHYEDPAWDKTKETSTDFDKRVERERKASSDNENAIREQEDKELADFATNRPKLEELREKLKVSIPAMATELYDEVKKNEIEAIKTNPYLGGDPVRIAEALKNVDQNVNYALNETRMREAVGSKRLMQRAEVIAARDNIPFGTKERTMQIMRQYPNIASPLERAGLVAELSNQDLRMEGKYGRSQYELVSKVRGKADALAEEINLIGADILKDTPAHFWNKGPSAPDGFDVLSSFGDASRKFSQGYEQGNTVSESNYEAIRVVNHIWSGAKDNSYSATLAKMREYQRKLQPGSLKIPQQFEVGTKNYEQYMRIEKMMEKIKLMVDLEQSAKALEQTPDRDGNVTVTRMENNGMPAKKEPFTVKIPSFSSMLARDDAAAGSRNSEKAQFAAKVEGNYNKIIEAVQPFDSEKELYKYFDRATKLVGNKLAVVSNNSMDAALYTGMQDKMLITAMEKGIITQEQLDQARKDLKANLDKAKVEMKSDPELMKLQAEIKDADKKFDSLKDMVPALIDRTAMVMAAEKDKEYVKTLAELDAKIAALPEESKSLAYLYTDQKLVIQTKQTELRKQMADKKITNPEIRNTAMDTVMNPTSIKDLMEFEASVKQTIADLTVSAKTDEEKATLEANKEQLAQLQSSIKSLTEGGVIADVGKVQELLKGKAALDVKAVELNNKVYVKAQQKIYVASDIAYGKINEEVLKYQAENDKLLQKISNEKVEVQPGFYNEQALNKFQKAQQTYRRWKDTPLPANATEKDQQERAMQTASAQMDMMKAQREYYVMVDKEQQRMTKFFKDKGQTAEANMRPENLKLKTNVAAENNTFDKWASEALRSAQTDKGRAAIAELVKIRHELLEARTDASLIGRNDENPFGSNQTTYELRERAKVAMSQLSLEERKALNAVNATYDATLEKAAPAMTEQEKSYRRLDQLVRGSAERSQVEDQALARIFKPNGNGWLEITAVLPGKPGESPSPADVVLAREMVRQLQATARGNDATKLLDQAKKAWPDINLMDEAGSRKITEDKLAKDGLIMVPTQMMAGSETKKQAERNYNQGDNYKVAAMIYDFNAPETTYVAVTEAEVMRMFKENVVKYDFERAYEGLKLVGNGKFVGADGKATEVGKEFLNKIAATTVKVDKEITLSPRAQMIYDDFVTKKATVFPDITPEYSAAFAEAYRKLNSDPTKAESATAMEAASSLRPGLVTLDGSNRAGTLDQSLKYIKKGFENALKDKMDPNTPRDPNFVSSKASQLENLETALAKTTAIIKDMEKGLKDKAGIDSTLMASARKDFEEMRRQAVTMRFELAQATLDGATQEYSLEQIVEGKVSSLMPDINPNKTDIEPEEKAKRIKALDINEPGISTEEKLKRVEMNYNLVTLRAETLEIESNQESGRKYDSSGRYQYGEDSYVFKVRQDKIDAGDKLMQTLANYDGPPLELTQQQKDTLNLLMEVKVKGSAVNGTKLDELMPETEYMAKIVAKTTTYKIPAKEIVAKVQRAETERAKADKDKDAKKLTYEQVRAKREKAFADAGFVTVPTQSMKQAEDYQANLKAGKYEITRQIFDPKAPSETYKVVTEAEAIKLFKDNVEKYGFDEAYTALKLTGDKTFIGTDGMPTANGKAFLDKVAATLDPNPSAAMANAPISKEADALRESWFAAKKVVLPKDVTPENMKLINEVIMDEIRKGDYKKVDMIISVVKAAPEWKDQKLLSETTQTAAIKAGKYGLAIKMLELEAKTIADTKFDATSETLAEFNKSQIERAKGLESALSSTLNEMAAMEKRLAEKGIKVTGRSPETRKMVSDLRQKSLNLRLAGAKTLVEGKADTESSVVRTKQRFKVEDYYQLKDENDPSLTAEGKKARSEENAKVRRSMEIELASASREDEERLLRDATDQAYQLMDSLKLAEGEALVLDETQKETVRRLVSSMIETGLATNTMTEEQVLAQAKQTAAAVKQATGFDVPVDQIASDIKQKKADLAAGVKTTDVKEAKADEKKVDAKTAKADPKKDPKTAAKPGDTKLASMDGVTTADAPGAMTLKMQAALDEAKAADEAAKGKPGGTGSLSAMPTRQRDNNGIV